eukprot:TRINITY_DN28_c0_g2_i3.p1 TRINITY_DN28_c0_g2~~TRINITY_DN28_c0_g2_i3.p1  ORF type:complete len:342 (-),score=-16.48 TRINITY_DN28_c0_g2_i3:274-1149(-)
MVTFDRALPYLPLITTGFFIFLITAYKTARIIKEHLAPQRKPILYFLYVLLNLNMLCYTIDVLFASFSGNGEKGENESMENCRRITFAIVYNVNNMLIFTFLVRALSSLRRTRNLGRFISGLKYGCWIIFGTLIVAETTLHLFLPGRNDGSNTVPGEDFVYMYAYYCFSGFFVFAYTAVVFFVFVAEMHRQRQVWIFSSQKLLTLFFLSQIIGQLNYSVYYLLKIEPIGGLRDYDDLTTKIFLYAHALFAHFSPVVLVVLIVSPQFTQLLTITLRMHYRVQCYPITYMHDQ